MATYFIGDVHGCADELKALLEKINFNHSVDKLYFTGDLIGRGPKPLETINIVMKLVDLGVAQAVMGNHELFYLSVSEGILKDKPKAMITELFQAPNAEKILDFIRERPFVISDEHKHFILSHAGIYPKWDLNEACKRARALETFFKDDLKRKLLLRNMYTDEVNCDLEFDSDLNHLRFALNVFTRMRFVNADLSLDYGHSSTTVAEGYILGLKPWFEPLLSLSGADHSPYVTIFGHWAALQGKCTKDKVKALDTGCLWGGSLSCYCLERDDFMSVKSSGYLVSKAKTSENSLLNKALKLIKG